MNIKNVVFTLSILASSLSFAALKPVALENTDEQDVVYTASSIYSLKEVTFKGLKYRLVSLDSKLNGDTASTSVLMVGDELGGEAGYENAFILTPRTLSKKEFVVSARIVGVTNKGVQISLFDINTGKNLIKTVSYDAAKKVLNGI